MKKLLIMALVASLAGLVRADEFVRVVKPIPAESNAVVKVSFRQAVTPVAFRVIGEAAGTNTVEAAIVSYAVGHETRTALVAPLATAATNVVISATGYANAVYPGDWLEFKLPNLYRRAGAIIVYAKK